MRTVGDISFERERLPLGVFEPNRGQVDGLPANPRKWTKAEVEVLRCAVMKYGIGSWKQITSLKILPGKTVSQIVCQVQRMIGQQSLKGMPRSGMM